MENVNNYKKYKNKLNHVLRTAKRSYYQKRIESSKSNIKATWNIINEILNKKKRNVSESSIFTDNDSNISDPQLIANRFCDYFSNFGQNLSQKIPGSKQTLNSYLSGNFSNFAFDEPVAPSEVVSVVGSLRPGTADGYDNIPSWIIKNSIDLLSEPLIHIVNLSIQTGIVPDLMKLARVIPIYKSGVVNLFSNYRPISILPVFSKILDKIVYNRLMHYLTENKILFHNQYDFRKNHPTLHALTNLLNKITTAFDEKKFTIGIFLHLSKAFDTVDHEIGALYVSTFSEIGALRYSRIGS